MVKIRYHSAQTVTAALKTHIWFQEWMCLLHRLQNSWILGRVHHLVDSLTLAQVSHPLRAPTSISCLPAPMRMVRCCHVDRVCSFALSSHDLPQARAGYCRIFRHMLYANKMCVACR